MTRAAINILGTTGEIIDVTSLGKSDFAAAHPGPGQYLVSGTLGMCPPPEGWGYAINQMDAGVSVATSYADGLLAVSVTREGVPTDLQHRITLHVSVEELPPIELPPPPESVPLDPLELALAEIAKRRTIADSAIAPLQDAADLEEATEVEAEALKAWRRYRIALSRLPDQPGYPEDIDWPVSPA